MNIFFSNFCRKARETNFYALANEKQKNLLKSADIIERVTACTFVVFLALISASFYCTKTPSAFYISIGATFTIALTFGALWGLKEEVQTDASMVMDDLNALLMLHNKNIA